MSLGHAQSRIFEFANLKSGAGRSNGSIHEPLRERERERLFAGCELMWLGGFKGVVCEMVADIGERERERERERKKAFN